MSKSHAKYYLYCPPSQASSTSSSSSTPTSPPSTPAFPSIMLSVVYPSQMYVANPSKGYYVQQPQVVAPAAGQWATGQWVSVAPSAQAGGSYVYAPQHQQHHQNQRPPLTTVAPPGYSLAVPQPRVRTSSTYGAQQRIVAAPVRSQSYPPTVIGHPAPHSSRPPMQRKMSSVSLRRGSFGSSDGIIPDADDFVPASPVMSEATSSSGSSSSGSSSGSSHLNISRSAMNHYTAPQRSRRQDSFGARRQDYDPLANRSTLSLPPPPSTIQPNFAHNPRQIAPPPISNGQLMTVSPQAQPNFVRTGGNSTRPVSFHENTAPVYSSYELYQPPPSHSRPPTTRPSLNRRASSRSLSGGIPDLSPGSYGSGLGMGAPGMGLYGSGPDYDSKKKWWKGGR